MITQLFYICMVFASFVKGGRSHVGQPCNKLIRICLASHSYCDEDNICRCRPDYPVNISLHSCRQGKQYNERCDYTEECSYYDINSYCSQLPYRSTCECHTGFQYDEIKKACDKVGEKNRKETNLVFPTAIGVSLFFACIICCCLVVWHVCKRHRLASRSRYMSPNLGSQRSVCVASAVVASAPSLDETLPTYDTALTLKESDDCEPPPSYDEVIGQDSSSKA